MPPPADPGDRLSQPKYLYDALRPPTSSASSIVGMTAATGKMANELAPVRLLRSSWVLKMAEQLQRATTDPLSSFTSRRDQAEGFEGFEGFEGNQDTRWAKEVLSKRVQGRKDADALGNNGR